MSFIKFQEPKRKPYCRLRPNLPLPIVLRKGGSIKKFKGIFNGFSVVITDEQDMRTMVSMGYFGKANFSRSYPQFIKQDESKVLRERQFKHRKEYSQNINKNKPEKIIVIPDSDSEGEDYFNNLKPKFELDFSEVNETVWLSLEEAYFLVSEVECLDIIYESKELNKEQLWNLFSKTQENFKRNYVVYYYYKSKNWVIKPGLKFGGDFLLYKQGPPFYHSSYLVIIEEMDERNAPVSQEIKKPLDNISLLQLNRLCETAKKELLLCRLKYPLEINFNNFQNAEIQEILVKRWIPSEERESL